MKYRIRTFNRIGMFRSDYMIIEVDADSAKKAINKAVKLTGRFSGEVMLVTNSERMK